MTDAAPENQGTPDETAGETPYASGPVPVLAVVGRPNVGKSTLVNRIIGRREAVVEDVPGVTRDRVSYDANWNGRAFTVVDTGGWDPDARGLAEAIRAQAEIAVNLADAVLFVVDATIGITDADEAVVQDPARVQEAGRAGRQQGRRPAHRGRGLRRCGTSGSASRAPVSALHGRGSGDMLDAILAALPEPPPYQDPRARRPAPHRDRRQAERRQVLAAQQAGQGGPGRRRRRRRHHRGPGRRADHPRRPDLALHRHRRHPQAGQGGVGPRVLRLAAHHRRDRARRGRVLVVDGSAARSPSRTSADHPDDRARPAGRW